MGAPDLHFNDLRFRWVRSYLVAAAVINLLQLDDWKVPQAIEWLRLFIALLSFATLRLVRPQNALRIGQITSVVLAFATLVVAFTQMHKGWPVVLDMILVIVVAATPIAGPQVAVFISVISVSTVVVAYSLPGAVRPRFFGLQLTNWILVLALLQAFMIRFARLLARGSAELAATADAMAAAGRATSELVRVLTSRVGIAVDKLAAKLEVSPQGATSEVDELQEMIVTARRAIPPEPALPHSPVWQTADALRAQTMDWSLIAVLAFLLLAAVRNLALGMRRYLLYSFFYIAIVFFATAFRVLRPHRRASIHLTMLVVLAIASAPAIWAWLANVPISPPVYPAIIGASLVAAVTVGIWLSFAFLTIMALTSVVALHFYPGIAWTAPVNLACACAFLAWYCAGSPTDAGVAIRAHIEAVAERIRDQRQRLAALFHELANPAIVIALDVELMAQGEQPECDLAHLRSLVRGMQASIASMSASEVTASNEPSSSR